MPETFVPQRQLLRRIYSAQFQKRTYISVEKSEVVANEVREKCTRRSEGSIITPLRIFQSLRQLIPAPQMRLNAQFHPIS